MVIIISMFTASIGCRRRCINEWNRKFRADLPQFLRKMEIQFIKNVLIELGGIRACSNVKHELNLVFVIAQPLVKLGPINTYHDLLVTQIHARSFMRGMSRQPVEIVDSDYVVKPILIESANKATANKTGGSCYNYHKKKVIRAGSGSEPNPLCNVTTKRKSAARQGYL